MSSSSLKEKQNFQCASEASLVLIKLPLKDILLSQIRPEDLFLEIHQSSLLHGKNKLRSDQLKLCYFPPPVLPDYNKFDAILLYTLIRNLCPGLKPTRGWGNEPGKYDIQVGDDIERLRLFRNNSFAHLSSAIIPDDTFEDVWKTLKSVLIRLKSHSGCSGDYVKELEEIEYSQFRYELWEQNKDIWKTYLEIKKQTDERVIRIKGNEEVICGNTAIFNAEVEHAGNFCLPIIWQRRRGKWVEIIDPTLEKYGGSTNTMLVMSSVCKKDAMEYQAFLPDGYNQMLTSNTINLHVLGEMPFLNDLEVTTEDEGIIIHYGFGVSENSPQVQDITWSKNGHPMYIESVKFIGGGLYDGCLIIKSPSEDDKGKYSCRVTNAVGSVTKDTVLESFEKNPDNTIDKTNIPYRVLQCSKCPEHTEFICLLCPYDLCHQCKANHAMDLRTIDHDVLMYREKINYIPKTEICARHPSLFYTKYCEPCQVPVCYHCRKHRKHKTLDIRAAYKRKRQQHRGTVHTIRSEALFYRSVLLKKFKAQFKIVRTKLFLCPTKAEKIKNIIDELLLNRLSNIDFKHRCSNHVKELNRNISWQQRYVNSYEQSAICPLRFLSFIKKDDLSQKHVTIHSKHLMSESFNKNDVIKSMGIIQIAGSVDNACLKLMYGPEVHQSLTVTGVSGCCHISCVKSDLVWVSQNHILILMNTTGVNLHRVWDLGSDFGSHTVNNKSELIYVDRRYNIKKASRDMTTSTTFIDRTDFLWTPRCVFCSLSTGDLLVGMHNEERKAGKVVCYNQSGRLTQKIQQDNRSLAKYKVPNYITENINGDVVVSDFYCGVVVAERGGRHRFSYTGVHSRAKFEPWGVCTDAMSHILVCNGINGTVEMINKDGHFLYCLPLKALGIFGPHSLSYDCSTHRIWVGSRRKNKLYVYRYMQRDLMKDLHHAIDYEKKSLTKVKKTKVNQPHLKVESFSMEYTFMDQKIRIYAKVSGVNGCNHISCVPSKGEIWVSDDKTNLILTNTADKCLHPIEDLCTNILSGLHSVNKTNELIYIDSNYNINKLSSDVKTTSILVKRADFTWKPLCVHCCPSNGNLLVGLHREDTKTGKVVRYNQSGKFRQTIQYDNTKLARYNKPNYITENKNGDIVVSDHLSFSLTGSVVVTDREGRYRFSYTGHPQPSNMIPWGICTDKFSHIFVCNGKDNLINVINKDGQFLSYLHITPLMMNRPHSLSYDVNNDYLVVGSRDNNNVCVIRYLQRDHIKYVWYF